MREKERKREGEVLSQRDLVICKISISPHLCLLCCVKDSLLQNIHAAKNIKAETNMNVIKCQKSSSGALTASLSGVAARKSN